MVKTRPIILLGGTGDVGSLLARNLAERGYRDLILCSRNPERGNALAHDLGALSLQIDASDKSNASFIPESSIVANGTLTEIKTEFPETILY